MVYKTHIATSLNLAILPYTLGLLPLFSDPIHILIFYTLALFFSLAPDLDEPNSYLSRRVPIVPYILRLFTTHRAFTHQFMAVILLLITLLLINYLYYDILIFIPVILLSYFGHILGDSFTLSGIRRFLHPISKKTFYGLPKSMRFRTGSIVEKYIVYPIIFILMLIQSYFFVFPLITEYRLFYI